VRRLLGGGKKRKKKTYTKPKKQKHKHKKIKLRVLKFYKVRLAVMFTLRVGESSSSLAEKQAETLDHCMQGCAPSPVIPVRCM
jgi:hypothetical protein